MGLCVVFLSLRFWGLGRSARWGADRHLFRISLVSEEEATPAAPTTTLTRERVRVARRRSVRPDEREWEFDQRRIRERRRVRREWEERGPRSGRQQGQAGGGAGDVERERDGEPREREWRHGAVPWDGDGGGVRRGDGWGGTVTKAQGRGRGDREQEAEEGVRLFCLSPFALSPFGCSFLLLLFDSPDSPDVTARTIPVVPVTAPKAPRRTNSKLEDPGTAAVAAFDDEDITEGGDAAEDDGDGHTYCVCNQVSFGEMIGCDGSDCDREWVRSLFLYFLLSSFSELVVEELTFLSPFPSPLLCF